MVQPPPASSPIIVRVVEQPKGMGLVDVVIGALGLSGALLLVALLLGLLLAGGFIWFRRAFPLNDFNGEASQQYRLRI